MTFNKSDHRIYNITSIKDCVIFIFSITLSIIERKRKAVFVELISIPFWFLHVYSYIEGRKKLGLPFGQMLSDIVVT